MSILGLCKGLFPGCRILREQQQRAQARWTSKTLRGKWLGNQQERPARAPQLSRALLALPALGLLGMLGLQGQLALSCWGRGQGRHPA